MLLLLGVAAGVFFSGLLDSEEGGGDTTTARGVPKQPDPEPSEPNGVGAGEPSTPKMPPGVQVPAWAKVSKAQTDEAKRLGIPVAIENKFGMRFVLIPAGTFQMGSPADEEERDSDEQQHSVRLAKAYYMSIHELTNAQYRRFKSDHEREAEFNGAAQPVVQVSHDDVAAYAKWLSGQDSARTYRLPTEAEWEYACRAGTTTPFSFGATITPAQANYDGNFTYGSGPKGVYREKTTDVGHFRPNPWGLYDMHGNVYEWCADWYGKDYDQASSAGVDPAGPSAGTSRVLRGGSWGYFPRYVRCASRVGNVPSERNVDNGCRLAFSPR